MSERNREKKKRAKKKARERKLKRKTNMSKGGTWTGGKKVKQFGLLSVLDK